MGDLSGILILIHIQLNTSIQIWCFCAVLCVDVQVNDAEKKEFKARMIAVGVLDGATITLKEQQ